MKYDFINTFCGVKLSGSFGSTCLLFGRERGLYYQPPALCKVILVILHGFVSPDLQRKTTLQVDRRAMESGSASTRI